MSNATEITARATAITTHEEWVAFMTDDANITEFAHEQARVVDVDRDDIFELEYLASEVQYYLRLEVMTDAELLTEYVANERAHRNIRAQDGWDYDVADYESHYRRQGDICALMEWRRLRRLYCSAMALTHNPFLSLLAARAA